MWIASTARAYKVSATGDPTGEDGKGENGKNRSD